MEKDIMADRGGFVLNKSRYSVFEYFKNKTE